MVFIFSLLLSFCFPVFAETQKPVDSCVNPQPQLDQKTNRYKTAILRRFKEQGGRPNFCEKYFLMVTPITGGGDLFIFDCQTGSPFVYVPEVPISDPVIKLKSCDFTVNPIAVVGSPRRYFFDGQKKVVSKGEPMSSGPRAKRMAPAQIKAISVNGVEYRPVRDRTSGGYVVSLAAEKQADKSTLWKTELYSKSYNENLEKDVQDIHLASLVMQDSVLVAKDEKGQIYEVDSRAGKLLKPKSPVVY